jgi:glycosyltransferase involved in cell wall biosynthesis
MSESTAIDHRRRWWKEAVKASIVGNFSAALVGGGAHARYLETLGFAAERVFRGYDAVDNAYFTAASDKARHEATAVRSRRGLPNAYFLASGRFIAIKNFERLIEAYAAYRASAGEGAWDLVILGDGELRPALEAKVRGLGLSEAVHLPGFKQYEDLPEYYALAGAFVHVSTVEPWGLVVNEAMASGLPVIVSDRCGCAEDLVRDGENGWRVPALDTAAIATRLADIAAADHPALGRASRAIVERFSPAAFASGLAGALEVALDKPAPARQAYHRQILKLARGL